MQKAPRILATLVVCVAGAAVASGGSTPVTLERGGSIVFADERSRARFLDYEAFLAAEPEKFADEIATIRQLERSEIQFVVAVCPPLGKGVEGRMTTDGERILVYVSDPGNRHDVSSFNSRMAHELEHARQFDSGELALARSSATSEWGSDYSSYDIGDEIRAWTAQLRAASTRDFWIKRDGTPQPTTLRHFAEAATDEARSAVLRRSGYARVNPVLRSDVRFATSTGVVAGQFVRPERGGNFFGRVRVTDDLARDLPR